MSEQPHTGRPGGRKSLGCFILGILAFAIGYFNILALIPGIIGIFLGSKALQELKQAEEDGRALTFAGLIAGSLGILLSIIGTVNVTV